jgi:hypothetical protein
MNVFGFQIKRNKQPQQISVVAPASDDGATVVNSAAGVYAQVMTLDTIIKNENDLIRRYREIALYPDTDSAIEDITNEAIVADEDAPPIRMILDDVKVSAGIKRKIEDEFQNVLNLLKFDQKGHDIFRTWYVDGRLYYHILVDEKNPKNGIVELRQIDPRKIRKIKTVNKEKNQAGVEIVKSIEEYYLYNDKGITEVATQGVKLPLDSVVYVPSGVIDQNSGLMLSYLHKAIKIVNQLKMMEDALVIYRISRAPERRIFYVDVGNLPKIKAEQYVNDIMNKFRNKIVYDATTGEVRDDRKHMSMMEDFWMPRREGGKGTEITTLPGGQTLGQIEDIEYFQNKLYQSLNVPASRLQKTDGFNLGRSSEITRDEIKFTKFVARIRKKFANLFLDALKIQLVIKGVCTLDDWEELSRDIRFDFMRDNHYAELKEAELLQGRLNILQLIDPFVGKYYSPSYVKKHILRLDDDEIEEMEAENEQHNNEMMAQELMQQQLQGDMQNQISADAPKPPQPKGAK